MRDAPLFIRGGRVIDPATGLDATADVLVVNGLVAAVSAAPGAIHAPAGARRLDAEGLIVAPGLIDPHVHFREPSETHEETIATGAVAAAEGGFTLVCCMPNTTPPLDEPDRVRFVIERGAAAGGARVVTSGCATRGRAGREVADLDAMARAGAVAFTDDGSCVADAGVCSAVLAAAKEAGRPFMQHCQEPALTAGASMNAGPAARRMGQVGWPAVAEEIIIERDVRLNRAIGCAYHAQHVSSGDSVEIIRRARERGQPVTAEASPHHLLLTDDACRTLGTAAKVNPPLRTPRDQRLLKEAVADRTITILATDHAPHPRGTKDLPFERASFGIVGLECALPLYVRALVEEGVVGWPDLLAMMTSRPAHLLRIDEAGFGRIAPGGPADLTIIDPHEVWTIDASAFRSRGRNCPFDGWKVRGRAVATIVGGCIHAFRAASRVFPPLAPETGR